MPRAGEHIDRCDLAAELIAAADKFRAVTRKRVGIAGNIDHPSDAALRYVGDQLGRTSLSRRVEDDGIGVDASAAFPLGAGKYSSRLRGIAAEKFRVFDTVQSGIAPRALNGVVDYFDTRQALCHIRHGKTYRACSAVEIEQTFLSGQSGFFACNPVKEFGSVVIHLPEGCGSYQEPHAAKYILYVILTADQSVLIAGYDIGVFSVIIDIDADDIGKFFRKMIGESSPECRAFASQHRADHDLTSSVGASDIDMAKYPSAAFLIICHDRMRSGVIKHLCDYLRKHLGLERTASVADHPVSPRSKESGNEPAFRCSDGILRLVSVTPGFTRRKHLSDRDIGQSRLDKGVPDICTLEFKLVFICYMPVGASAAALGRGAHILCKAKWGRFGHRHEPSDTVARIYLDDLSLDGIARDSAGNEDDSAVLKPSDSASEVIEIGELHPHRIVFVHA